MKLKKTALLFLLGMFLCFLFLPQKVWAEEPVKLYVMDSYWQPYLSLPEGVQTTYQLESGEGIIYIVISGGSVTVSEDGLVEPVCDRKYWHGNIATSPSQDYDRITETYKLGTTEVLVSTPEKTYKVRFEVCDYSDEYVDKVIDDYLAENITEDMTDLEKLDKIAAFPTRYNYSVNASDCKSMIITGGGDCWASANTIRDLCERVGIPSHLRYGANDPMAGSGHRNAVALIDGEVYVVEAGYIGVAPRIYHVWKENTGFYVVTGADGNGRLLQYDGFETEITIPETVNGKTITSIGRAAFSDYCRVEPTKIVLPETLTTLEDMSL